MKAQHLIFTFVLALLITLVVMLGIILLPARVLEIKSATVSEDVHPGENLLYTVDYCRYVSNSAEVVRTLHKVDESFIYPLPIVITSTPIGCHKTTVPLPVPLDVPPGEYYLLIQAKIVTHAIKQTEVLYKTNNFKIL